ncbi:unnamed protein product [Lymnaea stagnalis]|uniref:Uncharacterized protein n=1 Tax=Lymnaea stagnalis TaxID=6523 RepID=A0AAV2IIG5_LYMST
MFSFLFAILAVTVCLVASTNSFSIRDLECPQNGISQCMATVQRRPNGATFCQDAQDALNCVTRYLRTCFSRNDPSFLEALATYDITGLYQKMITMC